MKSFRRTVWLLLTHSSFTLLMILVLTIALQSLATLATYQQKGTTQLFEYIAIIDIISASLFGLYVGGALCGLRNSYLWKVNIRYRYTLVAAYVATIGLFTLLFAPAVIVNLNSEKALFVAPFTLSILASMFILRRSLLHRLLIPGALAILMTTEFDHVIIVLAMLTVSVGLIYDLTRTGVDSKGSSIFPSITTRLRSNRHSQLATHGQRSAGIFYTFVEHIASRQLNKQSQNIDWAILNLDIKFGLVAIMWASIFILISHNYDNPTNFVPHMFAIMVVISSPQTCRRLIPQMRTFAHTFYGAEYQDLKIKIIRSIDKALLANILLLLGLSDLSYWIFSANVNHLEFYSISLVVILIALAFNPLLLVVGSRKQSLRWVAACSLLTAFFYSSVSYLVPDLTPLNKFEILSSVELYAFIALCFVIRYLGTKLFYNQSNEMLFSD